MRCTTTSCKNKIRRGKKLCDKCQSREYRKKYPMKASYQQLRCNARRRGHEFTITLEYFEQFCYETDYLVGKGRTKECYSIDRIDPRKGYVEGNIQRMTVSNNSKKGTKILSYDWPTKTAIVIPIRGAHQLCGTTGESLPF